jgi:hypothetical protein
MFVRSAVRVLALALAVTFGWSLWVACADALVASSAQMACCKDGQFTCAPHGSAGDCCTSDAARPHHAIAIAKIDPVHGFAIVTSSSVLSCIVPADSSRASFSESVAPTRHDPGPPPYIAFSSLLI